MPKRKSDQPSGGDEDLVIDSGATGGKKLKTEYPFIARSLPDYIWSVPKTKEHVFKDGFSIDKLEVLAQKFEEGLVMLEGPSFAAWWDEKRDEIGEKYPDKHDEHRKKQLQRIPSMISHWKQSILIACVNSIDILEIAKEEDGVKRPIIDKFEAVIMKFERRTSPTVDGALEKLDTMWKSLKLKEGEGVKSRKAVASLRLRYRIAYCIHKRVLVNGFNNSQTTAAIKSKIEEHQANHEYVKRMRYKRKKEDQDGHEIDESHARDEGRAKFDGYDSDFDFDEEIKPFFNDGLHSDREA